jgi:CheY-like chemotaxis protein
VPRGNETQTRSKISNKGEQRSATSIDGQFIVCIDNEPDILDGMSGLLRRWGARPVTAGSKEDALSELERLRVEYDQMPALLLMDYHLDDKVTGLDVIVALRVASGIELPAVILTADYSEEIAGLVRAAGHALLHKPVKPAALRALINRILSRRVNA